MTKEKAKEFGLSLLHGILVRNEKYDPSYANLVKEAFDALSQPSLPSNLDEAAEKYAIQGHENHTNVNYINTYIEGKRIGFKAGAEWMAGQGYIKEGIARPDDCEIWVNLTDTDIKDGDKVIQVRKK